MDIENLGNVATTVISGTLVGILIGYAVKKVLRIGLVVMGIFFAALAYLQFQGMLNVNWNQIELVSKNTIMSVIDSGITGTTSNSV
ncbi:MAG: FUN14 domain-containing protein, partial [Nitrososphaeraceae archaeon]